MNTDQTHDPFKLAVLKVYCKHKKFMSLGYHENFKLFANWYLSTEREYGYEICPALGGLPWYRSNWDISELAKILKCSDAEILSMLEEILE